MFDAAIIYINEAQNLVQPTGYIKLFIEILFSVVVLLKIQKNFKEADKYIEKANNLSEQVYEKN